jgi:hypothetical protein
MDHPPRLFIREEKSHFLRFSFLGEGQGKHTGLELISRLFFFGRMRLSSFHASVHMKGEGAYAQKTSKTMQASWLPAIDE